MVQTLFVTGSFMLLCILTATVNKAIVNKTGDTYQAEAFIAATTLAEGLSQEISQKAFDEKTVTAAADSAGSFTAVGSLGKEAGEVYATFDDIDDYRGYTRVDSLANGAFTSSVAVQYLNPATLDTSAVRTYYKKVTITVTDQREMLVPVTLTSIISY